MTSALDTTRRPARNPQTIGEQGDSIVARKRFEYVRMTGEEFTADLEEIGMSVKTFARLTGSIAERVQKWADGAEDVPTWVPVLTAIFKNVDGAVIEARQEAAERIIRDLAHPERGEFPYLEAEDTDDDNG